MRVSESFELVRLRRSRRSHRLPDIREELINLGSTGRGQSGQDILQVFEGIDRVQAAGVYQAHPDSGGMAAVDRPGEEPIPAIMPRFA
jgi:hypothetical protein